MTTSTLQNDFCKQASRENHQKTSVEECTSIETARKIRAVSMEIHSSTDVF